MIRTFIGLDLPDDVVDDLLELQMGLPGVHWVEPEDLHLTLAFLGDVDGGTFDALASMVESLREEPFPVTISGVGQFPLRGEPRSLWAGVSESTQLLRLQRHVGRRCDALGAEPERRRFHPHITLARLDGARDLDLRAFHQAHSTLAVEPFLAESVSLWSSVLHPDGARYARETTGFLQGA